LTERLLTETSFDQAPFDPTSFDRHFTEESHLTEKKFNRKVVSLKKIGKWSFERNSKLKN
jgi:hypothetical protein